MSSIDAVTGHVEKDQKQSGRPEKPDEEAFKSDLEKAEKEHAAAHGKLVRRP